MAALLFRCKVTADERRITALFTPPAWDDEEQRSSVSGAEPFPIRLTAALLGLISGLPPYQRTLNPEVEAFAEGDDTRLVLVEGQAPGRQPLGEPGLDLERLSLVWQRAT